MGDEKKQLMLTTSLYERLHRAAAEGDGDPARLVRELHAITEDLVRQGLPDADPGGDFADLLNRFARSRLLDPEGMRLIKLLIQEHDSRLAAGAAVDQEEALAARYNFLRFLDLCGVESEAREELERPLAGWQRRRPPDRGAAAEQQRMQFEILDSETGRGSLLARSAEWAQDKKRLAELQGETLRLRADCARETQRGEAGRQRASELQHEIDEAVRQTNELSRRLLTYRDLDLYVQNVSRFSLYTRTRMDYERSVMRLTAEQDEAAEAVRPGKDFLVRGGAGTGKTIVLLHAFAAAVRDRHGELALDTGFPFVFLTYTRTLVKYDRYIAEILREPVAGSVILTADSFFQDRLGRLGKEQRIDYGVIGRLAEKHNTTDFFSPAELAAEIEAFIFANMVTRREYVDERIPRRGMRQPLTVGQREAVWRAREKMIQAMEHDGILSRNYSRCALVDRLRARPGDASLRDMDAVFVDESQDLTAADLCALKLMSRRGLVMAGDTGQTIYGVSSPYRRAGVDIQGRTRVLHTSFRNTLPIQEVADAYRAISGLEEEEGDKAVAFRDGPAPELYTAGSPAELLSLLLRKTALFIDALGYDPENIAILAPSKTDLATIGDSLGHAGYRWANIRDEEFSFKDAGTIRLSTLHSSKGLDFAVVLLYLPAIPQRGDFDERAGKGIVRNLIYVAMTRAMDNLNVFTLEGPHEGQQEEPLQDPLRVLREYRRRKLLGR
jgi:hypothetical protein